MWDNFNESFNLLVEKLSGWIDTLILHLPNIILAILVIVLVAVTSRWVRRGVRRMIGKFSNKTAVNKFFATVVSGALLLLAIILVLTILDLKGTVTSLLAGAGIAGLVVGLAFQDVLQNIVSGITIAMQDRVRIGDHVVTNDIEGKVYSIGLRFTEIHTFQGQLVILPNRIITRNPITNFTLLGERMVVLEVGVSYGDDLREVEEVTRKAIEDGLDFDKERGVDVLFSEFGDSSINFLLRFWLTSVHQPDFLTARSRAVMAVKKAYDENSITIPFPIRTLDFGIKGGKDLSKMLAGHENGAGDKQSNKKTGSSKK